MLTPIFAKMRQKTKGQPKRRLAQANKDNAPGGSGRRERFLLTEHNALTPMVGATLQTFRADSDAMQTGGQGPRINVKASAFRPGMSFRQTCQLRRRICQSG